MYGGKDFDDPTCFPVVSSETIIFLHQHKQLTCNYHLLAQLWQEEIHEHFVIPGEFQSELPQPIKIRPRMYEGLDGVY